MSVADVWCKSTELIAAFWLCASLFIVVKWSFETLKSWSVCAYTLLLTVFYTSCLNKFNSHGYALSFVCVVWLCACMCLYAFVSGRLTHSLQTFRPAGIACSVSSQKLHVFFLLSLCFTVLIMGYCLCVDISGSVTWKHLTYPPSFLA